MALFAQVPPARKKWLLFLAVFFLAVGLVVLIATTAGESAASVLGPLGTRRKDASGYPVSKLEEHFEALRVAVHDDDENEDHGDEENVDNGDDGLVGGEVDYDDYGGEERENAPLGFSPEVDNAEFFGDSDKERPAEEDYQEEDISLEDREAEEAADYDAEGLDENMDDSMDDSESQPRETRADLRTYDLTRERAVDVATQADGTLAPVVVTWANFHYLDFALNWVHHMEKTGCKTYLVGAMDDELLTVLLDRGVPTFGMSSGLSLDDFGWGTETFFKMGREKISLLQQFTKWGLDVVISDVDTVWMKDPLPYMARYPEADVLISSDHLVDTTSGDGGLEWFPTAGSPANIGVMMFRGRPAAAKFADRWMRELEEDDKYWDQNAFNDLMRLGLKPHKKGFSDPETRLFKAFNDKLRMGILPVSMFCSGHTFYIQDLPGRLGVDPYVVHGTFQYSGTVGKRNRFRERLLWEDDDAYFRHDVGFVSTTWKVSDRLLDATVKNERDRLDDRLNISTTLPHFRLVNQQIETVRALLALATVTKRAAVMPGLFCGLDRWWGPHDGHIPGTRLPQLPFMCPLDHVFNLEVLSSFDMPDWKESSFLDNPKASAISSRKLRVVTCNENSKQCDDGSKPATVTQVEGGGESIVKLLAKRTDTQIARALEGIADAFDLIEFDHPSKLWSQFEDHATNDSFNQKFLMVTDMWCCVEPEEGQHVGHIWYDGLAGSGQGHTDRWGRWIDMNPEWMPQRGP